MIFSWENHEKKEKFSNGASWRITDMNCENDRLLLREITVKYRKQKEKDTN